MFSKRELIKINKGHADEYYDILKVKKFLNLFYCSNSI